MHTSTKFWVNNNNYMVEDPATKVRRFDDAITICDSASLKKYMPLSSNSYLEEEIFLAFQKNLFPTNKTIILENLSFTSIEKVIACIPESVMFKSCAFRIDIRGTELANVLQDNSEVNNSAIDLNSDLGDIPPDHALWIVASNPIPNRVTKQYFVDCVVNALLDEGTKREEKERPRAIKCYEKAASFGSGQAMNKLASNCHQQGDYQQASIWHQEAAGKGITQSMYMVGESCREAQNYKKAVEWYEGATDIAGAALACGDLYSTGTSAGTNDVKRDDKAAFRSYKRAAELQNTEGMFKVASCYQQGTGTIKDPKEAVYWYRQAADKGHVDSLLKLSDCLVIGDGVKKNLSKAFECCEMAAKVQPASGKAKLELGYRYAKGWGVQKNFPEAVKCYKEAAILGVAEASTELDKLLADAKQSANDANLIALIDIEAERICKITDIAEQKKAVTEIGAKCFQILTAPKESKEDGKSNSKVEPLRERARLLNAQLAGMSAKNYSVIYAAIILASITSIDELSLVGFLQNTAKLQEHFANNQETLQYLRLWDRDGNLSILSAQNKGRIASMTRQLLATVGFK